MGTAALTLGIVGMVTWIIPPLGLIVSLVGLVLGILERFVSKGQQSRALAGIVLCVLGILLGIGTIVGLVTAGLIIEEWLQQYPGY